MHFTTLELGMEWLNQQKNPMKSEGLDKIRTAMEIAGNPHRGLPVIHITGTNGKGSTTAFLRQLLQKQGLKVGTFTSPHILRFNERFTYDNELISDEDLLKIINRMVDINEQMEQTEYGRLMFFELYTVMMALFFQDKQPDVCLIEVGIGGLLDPTNIIDGQVAVITTIGLDHIDLLGDTLEKVAYQKAGIIKQDASVVLGEINDSTAEVISQYALNKDATVYRYKKDFDVLESEHSSNFVTSFTWRSVKGETIPFQIQMIGLYQVDNAAVALTAFELWMSMNNHKIDWHLAQHALYETCWLARMEKVHSRPIIYIDGAHNVAGLKALRQLVNDYFFEMKLTILYAGLTTKNQEDQLPLLKEFYAEEIVISEFEHIHAMSVNEFDDMISQLDEIEDNHVTYYQDWENYINSYILDHKEDVNHMLLVTGSLYFVSKVREYLHALQIN